MMMAADIGLRDIQIFVIVLLVDSEKSFTNINKNFIPQPNAERPEVQMIHSALGTMGDGTIIGLRHQYGLTCFVLIHLFTLSIEKSRV